MRIAWSSAARQIIIAVMLLSIGFAYGFASHRNETFPYGHIRAAFQRVRILTTDERAQTETWLFQQRERELDLHGKLEALGYLQGYEPAGELSGVLSHDLRLAQPGVNLYVSGHAPGATLMSMDGTVLREWDVPFEQVCPDQVVPDLVQQRYWRRVRPLDDGGLLVIFDYNALFRLSPAGEIVWKRCEAFHHDLTVTPDGHILALRRQRRVVPAVDPFKPILDDEIELLTDDGKTVSRISIGDAFSRSEYLPLLDRVDLSKATDVFHTNTIKLLNGRHVSRLRAFREGNLLISLRNLDLIAIVDPDHGKVSWALAGMFRGQHEPLLLLNGNVLLFDNLGLSGRSRVIEFDPLSQEIVWSYEGRGEEGFRSHCCGSNQRLLNGNTLITDTDNGRAVEVTLDGRIAWEFSSPHRAGERGELVAVLMEMIRIENDAWGRRLNDVKP